MEAHEIGVASSRKSKQDLALAFLAEQVEVEATLSETIDALRLADGDPQALLLIDRELGTRGALAED